MNKLSRCDPGVHKQDALYLEAKMKAICRAVFEILVASALGGTKHTERRSILSFIHCSKVLDITGGELTDISNCTSFNCSTTTHDVPKYLFKVLE